MKKRRLEKTFLEELAKTSIVQIACNKVNLTRQTISRWKKEDPKFKRKFEEARKLGEESVCDLAESKMIERIKQGDRKSGEFYLIHHKKEYRRQSSTRYNRYNQTEKDDIITGIKYTIVSAKEEIEKLDELKKVRNELRELSRSNEYDD